MAVGLQVPRVADVDVRRLSFFDRDPQFRRGERPFDGEVNASVASAVVIVW